MDLFRPFLGRGAAAGFTAKQRRPEAIFSLSFSHLQTLTSDYHNSYAGLPEALTTSWVHGPLYVAPAILRYDRSEGWQGSFLSSIEAIAHLLQAHQMIEGIVRALLGMAIAVGLFSKAEAIEYLDGLHDMYAATSHSRLSELGFIVDQDLAMEDRGAATGSTLADRFDEMLFQENLESSAFEP